MKIDSTAIRWGRLYGPSNRVAHRQSQRDVREGLIVQSPETRHTLAYLGLVLALGLIAHCSPSTTPEVTQTAEPGPTATPGAPPPSPPPPTDPLAQFAGTYNSNFTKTRDDGCNFRPTFSGPIIVNVNPFRIQIETRVYPGTIQSNGSFNASGTNNISGFTASGSVSGQTNGSQISGSETVQACPGRTVIYNFTGNK